MSLKRKSSPCAGWRLAALPVDADKPRLAADCTQCGENVAGSKSPSPFASESGGFCGACILPECLRIAPDGSVQVALAAPANDWFEFIASLGEVLHLTRNGVSVVGQFGPLPRLKDWHDPVLPRDAEIKFQPNLAEHASLWAMRELTPTGVVFGLEARDVAGVTFQKIVLPPSARLDRFEQFVVEHQSSPEEAGCWFAPNHRASQDRNRIITGRVPFLRTRETRGAKEVRRLPVEVIARVLESAAGLPLRLTYYHRAMIRTVVWTPETKTTTGDSGLHECFFHGGNTGLHVRFHAISTLWLWSGRCHCCDEEHWTLEVADKHEAIGLAIKSAAESMEASWHQAIRSAAEL